MIILHGGDEFTKGCEKIDRSILSVKGNSSHAVVILPTAAANQNPLKAVNNGIDYFKKFGINAEKLMVLDNTDANNHEIVNSINNYNIIYLTGGDPDYLLYVLKDSLLIQRIKENLSKHKCILIGSSAGAMVLGAKMWRRSLVASLGIINGLVLPHYESNNLVSNNFEIIQEFQESMPVMGIDSKTSCFYNSEKLQVIGTGKVVLFFKNEKYVLYNGQSFVIN